MSSTETSATTRLTTRSLVGFGLAAVPSQFMYILILIMYLKYAVDDLGASAAAVGTIFLVAKLWDAVSDPLIGNLSDRTQSRWGRRRPWLCVSAPLLSGFAIMVWVPPAGLDGAWLIAWITVAVLGFYTAFTIFDVPHMALGAELTFERQERNRVFGIRQAMRILGMLAAGTGGAYLVQQGAATAALMSYVAGVLTLVFVIGGVSLTPAERPDFAGRGGDNPFRAVRDVFANRHARLLLFVFFIESIGSGGIGVLTPFVVEYVMKMQEIVPILLGVFMVSSLAAVPLWVWLGNFFEKRRLWLFAMVQGGIGYGLLFWLGEGDWLLMTVSSILSGTASACGSTLGQALKSEVIDFDEYQTGERKEGAYFAGWSFMSKLAAGIMVGVVGYSLELTGYVENAAEQTEQVKDTMIFLMGGVPLVGYGIGSLMFTRFSLSEAEHARIRAELDSRAFESSRPETDGPGHSD
ncbi:MAG: MFS transporter [Myxococcales bacterium]|nr:MFS transporter [Myxococcales bacterium]